MGLHLLLRQLLLKLLPNLIQHRFKGAVPVPEIIPRLDPAEKVEHGIGREKFPQVHRDHQHHRPLLLLPRHFFMDGAKQRRSQKYGHGHPLPAGMLQHFLDRENPLVHPEPAVFLLRFFQLVGTAFALLRPARLLGIIFDKAVILLILDGHILRVQGYVLQALVPVRQVQVILYQLFEKLGCACAVCQDMEHFKIDSLLIISHLEQQGLFVPHIDPAAGFFVFFSHDRAEVAFFQVMPEQPLAEHRPKQRIGVQGTFQRRFQQTGTHILLQFTVKSEYPGILLIACRRKELCRVVQTPPVSPLLLHGHSLLKTRLYIGSSPAHAGA